MLTSPYLTDKDQRVLLVPMEREPDWQDMQNGKPLKVFIDTFCPIRVGDMVPVREEWRVDFVYYGGEKDLVDILYRDGSRKRFYVTTAECPEIKGDWQPAETMPDFAVRYWRQATKVEAQEVCERARVGGDSEDGGYKWFWRIEIEPQNNQATPERGE